MAKRLEGQFILSLTEILTGNIVDPNAVKKAIQLICEEIQFNNGMIYEPDFTGKLCLKEHFSSDLTDIFKFNSTIDLTVEEQTNLSQGKIFYITKNSKNTSIEERLLKLFKSESLIFAPVANKNFNFYGLVIFTCTDKKSIILQEELQILPAIISILVRYVAMRLCDIKLVQVKASLEKILDNTGIDIYVNDYKTHEILYVNKSMAAPYGGREKLLGEKCWQILFPGQIAPCEFCPQTKLVDEQGDPTKVYSWDYQRPFDGSWFRVFSAAFDWMDGRLAHVVSSANITDNKINEALIEYMANYDDLTKLPNRRMFLKECEHRINKASEAEKGYILFFDIDGFKLINDNLGHDAGDEFLILLGEFFMSIPLLKNSIYRNGGDEFVAIIGGELISKDNISSLGHFIHERFKKPWILKKGEVFCNTSIGVACYPEDGTTAEKLIQKSDEAMYKVKKSGGGGLCFGYQLKEEK